MIVMNRRSVRSVLAATAAILLASSAAWAQGAPDVVLQTRPPATRTPPARKRKPIGVKGFVSFDTTSFLATNTFDAVFGTHQLHGPAGGGEVLNLWKGVFLRAAVSTVKEDGSRVAVAGSSAQSVGIGLSLNMLPVELGAGWRFDSAHSMRAVPYIGAGILRLHYRESSDFSDPSENTDTWFRGSFLFGGVDVKIWSLVMAGVEAQYRTLPDALGSGGASQAFNETDLGGTTLRVFVGIRK